MLINSFIEPVGLFLDIIVLSKRLLYRPGNEAIFFYIIRFVWIARGLPLSRRIRHLEERWAYYFAFGWFFIILQ